jgi:hypothetical protein
MVNLWHFCAVTLKLHFSTKSPEVYHHVIAALLFFIELGMEMESKKCIACFEPIQNEAKVCPHCRYPQSKLGSIGVSSFGTFLGISILILILGWILYAIAASIFEEDLSDQLQFSDSKIVIKKDIEPITVSCIAEVMNNSLLRWYDFSLQAEFVNNNNEVIDVHHKKVDFSVYPNFSFKGIVVGVMNADAKDYYACKMKVIDAESY